MYRSHDRRFAQRAPVLDRLTDRVIVAVILGLFVLLAALSFGGGGEARGAQGTPAAARMVDVRAERLLRAWCPASMPRRHCVAWMRVAQCETGDPDDRGVTAASLPRIRWRYDGASGYDGAVQFSPRTWRGNIGRVPARKLTRSQFAARARGAYAFAHEAPPAVQLLAADALRTRRGGGMGHWPSCGGRWRP